MALGQGVVPLNLLQDRLLAMRTESRLGRIVVGRLLPHMRREMDRNAWKGDGWREAAPADLVDDLLYHGLKLARAVDSIDKDTGHVREHSRKAALEFAADVANLAAMLADNVGALDPALKPNEGPALGWGGDDLKRMASDTACAARALVVEEPDY